MPRIMCHHHALSDSDREFITKKVDRLKKFFDRIAEVSVILDAEKRVCVAELLIFGPQLNLRVRHSADDMRTAFEEAINKAERTLTKTKDRKWGDKKGRRHNVTIRRLTPEGELPEEVLVGAEAGTPGMDLAVEHIEPLPMSFEEARAKMESARSGIIVFVNPKTDEVNLLHRNSKGQVELLELTGTLLYHPSEEVMSMAEGQ